MTLGPGTIVALFATMLLLAALPGAGSLTVAARSAAYGFRHGAIVTCGIVTGDALLVAAVYSGLAIAAQAAAGWYGVMQLASGAWLAVLGIRQWRPAVSAVSAAAASDVSAAAVPVVPRRASLAASYAAGLVLTLADLKALLFYAGFVPAFVDVARASPLDAAVLVTAAAVAIAIAKLAYAFAGGTLAAAHALRGRLVSRATQAASVVLVCAGLAVATSGAAALLR